MSHKFKKWLIDTSGLISDLPEFDVNTLMFAIFNINKHSKKNSICMDDEGVWVSRTGHQNHYFFYANFEYSELTTIKNALQYLSENSDD